MKTYKFVVKDDIFKMEVESTSSVSALNEFILYNYGAVYYTKNVTILRIN